MSLKENSPTYKPLPIKLDLKWSEHLPSLVWRGYFLSEGRPSDKGPVVVLDHLLFAEALDAASLQLGYVDFLFSMIFLKSISKDFEPEKQALESQSNFRWNEETEKLAALLPSLPENFKDWAKEKKLAFNDLRPLLRSQCSALQDHLRRLAELNPSKSVGTALIETLCDLSPNEIENCGSVESVRDAKNWLEDLSKAKNPLTSSKDQKRREVVEKWPWPARMNGRWKRWGDQAGLEVQLSCLNPEDLDSKIAKLTEISKKWQKELP